MQIKSVTFHRFKRFKDTTIELKSGLSLLAGVNNSGKSTLLHGLAVWEYCKTVLEMEKGREALMAGANSQGVGVGDDEFTPISIPSLRHLWTNLKSQKTTEKDGYTLWIDVAWETQTTGKTENLKIGLSLVNDRLFIKPLESSLTEDSVLPVIAYVTPFAGIQPQEPKYTPAQIRRFIGQGLPGSVLRNILLGLKTKNDQKRAIEKTGRKKLRGSFLRELRRTDPFEKLQAYLQEVFSYGVSVQDFNEVYHTVIRVETFRGEVRKNRFLRLKNFNSRDLMVEGSGFLQWLTVVALALAPETTTLLLDEPDAHLHSTLQTELIQELEELSKQFGKQVLFASHSTELIKSMPLGSIIRMDHSPKYLNDEAQRTAVVEGVGSFYSPRLYRAQQTKRIFFVENESDAKILNLLAEKFGIDFPSNVLVWPSASRHNERKHVFLELSKQIEGLSGLSLVDRDTDHFNTVNDQLVDKNHQHPPDGFVAMKWRRRNIESYLLVPTAIARACQRSPSEIETHLSARFSVVGNGTWGDSPAPQVVLDTDGKRVFEGCPDSIEKKFGCDKYDVARALEVEEIPPDIRIVVDAVIDLSR
jgi:predicted ATPase